MLAPPPSLKRDATLVTMTEGLIHTASNCVAAGCHFSPSLNNCLSVGKGLHQGFSICVVHRWTHHCKPSKMDDRMALQLWLGSWWSLCMVTSQGANCDPEWKQTNKQSRWAFSPLSLFCTLEQALVHFYQDCKKKKFKSIKTYKKWLGLINNAVVAKEVLCFVTLVLTSKNEPC